MDRATMMLASRAGRIVLATALGLANAAALLGWSLMNPTNTAWLFGDTATYYVGWGLYRYDTHLSFPLAWTDRVGYPVGTSIALLDAIPLLAVLLRPLSPILPEPFQYLGLYSALCFVLQAYFGLSLCRRLFPSSPLFIVLGSAFFVLSAPLTWRASGHTALLSHWLIVAGLACYFRDPDRATPVRWLGRSWIVLALAGAINPYVAAMCFLVTLAAVGRLLLERRVGWPRAAVLLVASAAVLFASLASVGVLVTRDPSTYWAPGYGAFSFNLNSPVNPMAYGSILLPPLALRYPQQYEGYNYLGLGIIALIVLNVARRPQLLLRLAERRQLPLVGLVLLSTALAASTSVTFGPSTLLQFQPPAAIASAVQGLRASGRLFWPAYYLIVAAALSSTFLIWKPPARVVILALALAVQLADLTPLRHGIRASLGQRFDSPLTSPAWKGLGKKYDDLILIPPYQCDPATGAGGSFSYVTFGKFAVAEQMRSNSYYGARYTRPELLAHCVDLLRTQLQGTLNPRSAYVVTDSVQTVWALAGMRSHTCQQTDGYNLCTPAAPSGPVQPQLTAPEAAPYVIDEELVFTEGGGARPYQTFGWGMPVPDGSWTEGPMAMMRLGLHPGTDRSRALVLAVNARPFVERGHRRVYVDVVVNGQTIDQWLYRTAGFSRRQARIPAALAARRAGLDIELRLRNPESPLYLGAGPLSSFIGLNVRTLVVSYE